MERGDCRGYRAFNSDPRWSADLERARRSDTEIGSILRLADTAMRLLEQRDLLDGPGSALVRGHPLNEMLVRKGLLRFP